MTDHNDDFNELEALIAVGGNSRLALSLRARRQLRDPGGKDGGQWVYMGGGAKRALRRLTAAFTDPATGAKSARAVTGTVTQPGSGDSNIELHITPVQARELGIKPGFYDVNIRATSEVEAELSEEALQRAGVKAKGLKITTATPDFESIERRDLPIGWKKGKKANTYETEGGDFTYSVTPDGKGVVRDNLTGKEQAVDDWVDAIAFANSSVLADTDDKMPESREEAAALQAEADAEEGTTEVKEPTRKDLKAADEEAPLLTSTRPMSEDQAKAYTAAQRAKYDQLADPEYIMSEYGLDESLADQAAERVSMALVANPGDTIPTAESRIYKAIKPIVDRLVKKEEGLKAKELYATITGGEVKREPFNKIYGSVPDQPKPAKPEPVAPSAEELEDVQRDPNLIADANEFQKAYKDAFKKNFYADDKSFTGPKIRKHFKELTGRDLSDGDATKLLALRKTDAFQALEAKINQQAKLKKDQQDLTREEAFDLLFAAEEEISALDLDDKDLQEMLLDEFRSDELYGQTKLQKDVAAKPVATIPAESAPTDADAVAKRKAEIAEENSNIVAELAKLREAKEAAGGKLSAADQKKFDELSAQRSALLEEMNSFPKEETAVEEFEFDLSAATPLDGTVRNAVSSAVDALPKSLQERYRSSNYRRRDIAPATAEDVAKEQEIYDEYVSTIAPFIAARIKATFDQEQADGNPDAQKNYDNALKELEDVLWQDISSPAYVDAATKLVGGTPRAMMVSKSLANLRKHTIPGKPATPTTPATPATPTPTPDDIRNAAERTVIRSDGTQARIVREENGDITVHPLNKEGVASADPFTIKKRDISASGLLGVRATGDRQYNVYHIPTGQYFPVNQNLVRDLDLPQHPKYQKGFYNKADAVALMKILDEAPDINFDFGWSDRMTPDGVEQLRKALPYLDKSRYQDGTQPKDEVEAAPSGLEPGTAISDIQQLNDAPSDTEIHWMSPETNLPIKKFVKIGPSAWHSLKEDGTPTAAKVPKKTLEDLVNTGNLETPATPEEAPGDVTSGVALADLRSGDQIQLPNGKWATVTKATLKNQNEVVISLDNGLELNTKTPIPGQPRSVDAVKAPTGFNSPQSQKFADDLRSYRDELLAIIDQADNDEVVLNDRYREKIDNTVDEIDTVLEETEKANTAIDESLRNMLLQGGTLTDVERMNQQYETGDVERGRAADISTAVKDPEVRDMVDAFRQNLDEANNISDEMSDDERAEYVSSLLEQIADINDIANDSIESGDYSTSEYEEAMLAVEVFQETAREDVNKLARGKTAEEAPAENIGDEIDSFLDEIEAEPTPEVEAPAPEEEPVETPAIETETDVEVPSDIADEIDSFLDEIEAEPTPEPEVEEEPEVTEEPVVDTTPATEEDVSSALEEFAREQSYEEFIRTYSEENPESEVTPEDFETARQNVEEILQRDNFSTDDYDELEETLRQIRESVFGEEKVDETPIEPLSDTEPLGTEDINEILQAARADVLNDQTMEASHSVYPSHIQEGDTIEPSGDYGTKGGKVATVTHRTIRQDSSWAGRGKQTLKIATVTYEDGTTETYSVYGSPGAKRINLKRPTSISDVVSPSKLSEVLDTKNPGYVTIREERFMSESAKAPKKKSAAREKWDAYEASVLEQAKKRLPVTDVDVATGSRGPAETATARKFAGLEHLKRAKSGDRIVLSVDGKESEWVKFNDQWFEIDADGNAIIEDADGNYKGLGVNELKNLRDSSSTKGAFYESENSGIPQNLTDYAQNSEEAKAQEQEDDSTVDSLNNKIAAFNGRLRAIQDAENKIEDALKYGFDKVPYTPYGDANSIEISIADLAALREQLYEDVAAIGGDNLTDDQRDAINKKKFFLLGEISKQKGKNKADTAKRKRPYEEQLELLQILENGGKPLPQNENGQTVDPATGEVIEGEEEEEAPWWEDPAYAVEDLPRAPRVDFDAPLFQSKNVRNAIEEQQKIDEANRDLERLEKIVQGNFPNMTKVRQHEAYIDMLALRGEIIRREKRLARLKAKMSQDEISTFSRVKSEPGYMPLKVQEAIKDFDMLKRDAIALRDLRRDLNTAANMKLEKGGGPLIDFLELKKAEEALFERRAKLIEDIQRFEGSMNKEEEDLFKRYMFQESIRLRKNDPDNYDDILRWSSPVMPCVPQELCGGSFEGRKPVRFEDRDTTENLPDLQAQYLEGLDNIDDLNRQVRDIYDGLNTAEDADDATVARLKEIQDKMASERAKLADLDRRIAAVKEANPPTMSEADQQEMDVATDITSTDDLRNLAPGAAIRVSRGEMAFELVRGNRDVWFPVDNEGNYGPMPMTPEDVFELFEIGMEGTVAKVLRPSSEDYPDLTDHRDGTQKLLLVNPDVIDRADVGTTIVQTNSVDIDPENPNGEVERVPVARFVRAAGAGGQPQWFKISSRTGKRNQRPLSAKEVEELKLQVSQRNVIIDDTDIAIAQVRKGELKKAQLIESLNERIDELQNKKYSGYMAPVGSEDRSFDEYNASQWEQDRQSELDSLRKAIAEVESGDALEFEAAKLAKKVPNLISPEEIKEITGVSPTDEQVEIINWFLSGESAVVLARAGSGKTTTMRMLLQVMNRRDVLYTSFTNSVIEDGRSSLPRGTFIETLDALGFAANKMYRSRYNRDLESGKPSASATKYLPRRQAMTAPKIAEFLQIDQIPFRRAAGKSVVPIKSVDVADRILDTIENFANDDVDKITTAHLSDKLLEIEPLQGQTREELHASFVEMAQKLWDERIAIEHRIELDDSPTGYSFVADYNGQTVREFIPLSNGLITKLWQLSGTVGKVAPKIQREIGVIVVDEAQDLNKMQASIIDQMADAGVQVVMVGDPNQSIFEWRGGTDQLDKFAAKFGKAFPLSQTFRSGPVVTSVGNVFLFLGGENTRTLSGRPEMAGKIRVSSESAVDLDDLPDFLKGNVELIDPKSFTEGEGLREIDAMLTLENAPIIEHLLRAASLDLAVSVNENFRDDVLSTLDAFDILKFPPQSPIRLMRAGQLGLFSDDRGRLAELPFEFGVPGVPESSIMGWWRASRAQGEGEGPQGPPVPTFPSQQLSTFLGILDKKNALPKITSGMTDKERQAEIDRAAKVREGIAEVVRAARPDTSEKENDQNSLYVEKLEFDKDAIRLPASRAELADMSIDQREGDLIPGAIGYTIQPYGQSQTKFKLLLSGTTVGLRAMEKRFNDARNRLMGQGLFSESASRPNFKKGRHAGDETYISNVDQSTLNVILDEMAKESRLVEPPKAGTYGEFEFPETFKFKSDDGTILPGFEAPFYKATARIARDKFGNMILDGDGMPIIERGEFEMPITIEASESGIDGRYVLTLRDTEGGRQRIKVPGKNEFVQIGERDPLPVASLRALGFYKKFEPETPVPGSKPEKTGRMVKKPLRGADGRALRDSKGNVKYEEVPEEKQPVLYPSGEVWQFAGTQQQLEAALNALRYGTEPGDALMDRFASDLLIATVFRDKGREHKHVALDDTITMISNAREGTNLREHHRKHYVAVTRAQNSIYLGPLSPVFKLAQDFPRLAADSEEREVFEGLDIPVVGPGGSVDQNANPIWSPNGPGLPIPYYEAFGLTYGANRSDEDGEGETTPRAPRRERPAPAPGSTQTNTRGATVRTTTPDSGLRFQTPEGMPELNLSPEYKKSPFAKSANMIVAEAGRMRDAEGNLLPNVDDNLMSIMRDSMTGVHIENNKDRLYDPRQIFDAIVLNNEKSMTKQEALDDARTRVAGLLDELRGDTVNSDALNETAPTATAPRTREPRKISQDPGIKVLRAEKKRFERLLERAENPANPTQGIERMNTLIDERIAEINDGISIADTQIADLKDEAKLKGKLDAELGKQAPARQESPLANVATEDTEDSLLRSAVVVSQEIKTLQEKLEKLREVKKDNAKMERMTQEQRTRLSGMIMDAEKAIADLNIQLDNYNLQMENLRRLAEQAPESDLVEEEAQMPSRSESALTPDTMAEIFDRYQLLAEYKKAIAEGKLSIPLEYSAGGKSNRYSASLEEVLEALQLAGITDEELVGE